MSKLRDLTGLKIERLTVIQRALNYKKNGTYWLCKCDCGNTTIVLSSHLTNKFTRSCGCLRRDKFIDMVTKHGLAKSGNKHPLYIRLMGMIARCKDTNSRSYKDYGGRGITVCDEWIKDPRKFIQWIEDNRIEGVFEVNRLNTDSGNYSPSECNLLNHEENCNNKRNNTIFTYNNETLPLTKLVKKYSILGYETVRKRLKKGWSIEKALLEPIK